MFSSQGLVPVLIVDDEPPILEKLASFSWESVGCKLVGSASSYTSALRLFESAHPRIVVTDIQMPGKNGLELAQIIHENDPDVQFIFITLFSDFSYAKHAISLGASDYLVKGIYTEEDITSALEKAKQRLLTCQHSETRERVDKAQEEMELLGTYFIWYQQRLEAIADCACKHFWGICTLLGFDQYAVSNERPAVFYHVARNNA